MEIKKSKKKERKKRPYLQYFRSHKRFKISQFALKIDLTLKKSIKVKSEYTNGKSNLISYSMLTIK